MFEQFCLHVTKLFLAVVVENLGFRLVYLKGCLKIAILYLHSTVGLSQSETVKKNHHKIWSHFWSYRHSWIGREWIFFKLCLDTRGRSNHFAQSLNFEPKYFLDNYFLTKIGSRVLWIHFFQKNLVEMAKTTGLRGSLRSISRCYYRVMSHLTNFFFDQNFSMRLKITKKSFLFNFSTIGLHHSLQPLEAFILYCTLTVKLLVELYQ